MTATMDNTTKWVSRIFLVFVFASLLTPLVTFTSLLFPFVTSKAFLFRICIEIALPFYLFLIAARPDWRPSLKNPLNIAVLVFVAINVITAFTGVNVTRSLWGNFERMGGAYYLAHLAALYFYVLMLAKISENFLQWFLRAVIISAGLVTLNGFSGWLGGPVIVLDPSLPSRVSSTFGNPIFLGSFLILPFTLTAYLTLSSPEKWQKWTYGITSVLFLWGILISGTRGAAVGLIAGALLALAIAAVAGTNGKIRAWILGIMAVFILIMGLGFGFAKSLPQGTLVYRLFNLRDSNSQARLLQWKMAWQGSKERPLTGVGAENYYVIANKHNDPAIYQYDRSWFDKPHNYFLEILATNGWPGFLAYIAMLVLVVFAFWRSYKEQLLSGLEMAVLIAGFFAYSFQNLFVFDTIAASVMFYLFCGFAGYCLEVLRDSKAQNRAKFVPGILPNVVLGVSGVVMLYALFVTNIFPIRASKDINIGLAYAQRDPKITAAYFESMRSNTANFDQPAGANRFSEYLETLLRSDMASKDSKFVIDQVDKVTEFQRQVTEKFSNDPVLWIHLASGSILQALVHGQPLGEKQEAIIQKAVDLAPTRPEPLQVLLQLRGYQERWPDAVAVAKKISEIDPTNTRYKAQLASAYARNNEMEKAAQTLETALAEGYRFKNAQEFTWLLAHYESAQNYSRLVELYEKSIELGASDQEYFLRLARAYKKIGNTEKANSIKEMLILQSPNQSKEIEAFING